MSGPIPVTTQNAAEVAKAVKAGELPGPAKSLAEALARIYADGGRYVQKTGQMQGVARYSYAKEGDFIATIRPLMEAHGVTIRPTGMDVILNEPFTRANGGTSYRVVLRVTFTLLHSSGDSATVQTCGEGIDTGDKAFNKAMTGAMKYAMRQTFCVETGDDPDDTPSHEQERRPAQQQAPQSKPAQQPAPVPVADNLQLRAKHAQAYGQCKSNADYQTARKAVVADIEARKLSNADIEALKRVDADVLAKFPAKQTAKA